MNKFYVVKRASNGTWNGMYDNSALYSRRELAELDQMWANREANGHPVVLIEVESDVKVILEAWVPAGTSLPPTYSV